jgi:hypothetical protein
MGEGKRVLVSNNRRSRPGAVNGFNTYSGFFELPFDRATIALTWPKLSALRLPRNISLSVRHSRREKAIMVPSPLPSTSTAHCSQSSWRAEMLSVQTIESPTTITHDPPVFLVFSSV